ncbi:HoxN/HupN/NixA family nickel/cobalt transporter [Teichococcus aestuarii]|uniref:HoxN/HupN/NixA family nickel/cobalt transporter n=1 Tax=Teichococcus aestuarii TaxID=568898 RepID=UPI00361D7098
MPTPWLFIPSAILLGALHGLEPGHSKTMMAAFIVAVRGTVTQAVLLGIAATFSHTLVVWGIGLGGLYLWKGLDAETAEPYFQLASAVAIIAMAIWMLWRTGGTRGPAGPMATRMIMGMTTDTTMGMTTAKAKRCGISTPAMASLP